MASKPVSSKDAVRPQPGGQAQTAALGPAHCLDTSTSFLSPTPPSLPFPFSLLIHSMGTGKGLWH